MADIELVIKIPESQYKTLNAKSQTDVVDVIDDKTLIDAIKNGAPLPKGHGRLIDADTFEAFCAKHKLDNDMFSGKPLIEQGFDSDDDAIWKPLFDFAPTIIEKED